LTAGFGQERVGRVGPLDRASPSIALGEEGQDPLGTWAVRRSRWA
jgi:hypothetical protein